MDIDKLEAGPETDVLVAEKVMGYTRDGVGNLLPPGFAGSDWAALASSGAPPFSTDWVAAGEVMEKLEYNWSLGRDVGQCGDDYETSGDKLYRFVYSAPGMPMQGILANTAPLAICRTVLKAVEGE